MKAYYVTRVTWIVILFNLSIIHNPLFALQTNDLIFNSNSSAVVVEGTTDIVLDINTTEGNNGATDVNIHYAITGIDAGNFKINTTTGELSFTEAPYWENPVDTNTDNIYELTVIANNGGTSAEQNIKVFVFPESKLRGTVLPLQLGHTFMGEVAGDLLGQSISLSSDGKTLALGADGNASGHVSLYRDNDYVWLQIGSDIEGEVEGDNFGHSVSLSADGNTVAIGAYNHSKTLSGYYEGYVRLYRFDGLEWQQIGNDIDGESKGDHSGFSVSLSADGDAIAIGAPFNDGNGIDSGQTRLYRYNGLDWQQIGKDIDGKAAGDNSGMAVGLSADGSIVAIGASGNNENGNDIGRVRIYSYNHSGWNQLGNDIIEGALNNISSYSVSLSADGSTVAIGSSYNEGNGDQASHVRLYYFNGSQWQQMGSDIDGEAVGNYSGNSVSLSADGSIVAIGAPYNGENDFLSGQARLFRFDGWQWKKFEFDIFGETAGDLSGNYVSLSADGRRIAIGSHSNDGNSIDAGQVKVFVLNETNIPSLINSLPANGTTDFEGTTIFLGFNTPLAKVSGTISLKDASDDSVLWSVGVNHPSVVVNFSLVTLNLRRPLPMGKEVYLNIDSNAFRSKDGIFFKGISDNTTLRFFTPTLPALTSSTPTDETTEFDGSAITLTFDREMEKGTGSISIHDAEDGSALWSVGVNHPDVGTVGETATLNLRRQLPTDKEVYLNIDPTAFKDTQGRFYAGISDPSTLNFFTTTTPKLLSSLPEDNAIGFDGSTISLTFDREIYKGMGTIALMDASDDSQLWAKGVNHPNISINGAVVTLDLKKPLDVNTNVYVNIAPTAFKDANGKFFNGISDNTTLNFNTLNSGAGSPAMLNVNEGRNGYNYSKVSVYPNPTSQEVSIELNDVGEEPTVIITNLSGVEMFRKERVATRQLKVDVSSYSQGVFLILVKTQNGEVFRKKMSVVR